VFNRGPVFVRHNFDGRHFDRDGRFRR